MTHHARAIAPFPTRTQSRPAIGLLTPHNPFDPRAFSGTVHYATRALTVETGLDIRLLCGHRPATFRDRLARRMGRTTAPALRPGDLDGLDAVIGLVASDLLDALPHDMPFFHVTDATPRHLAEAYGWDIPETSYIREARVAGRAVACLYSSETVAARARTGTGPGRALRGQHGASARDAPCQTAARSARADLRRCRLGAERRRYRR